MLVHLLGRDGARERLISRGDRFADVFPDALLAWVAERWKRGLWKAFDI